MFPQYCTDLGELPVCLPLFLFSFPLTSTVLDIEWEGNQYGKRWKGESEGRKKVTDRDKLLQWGLSGRRSKDLENL